MVGICHGGNVPVSHDDDDDDDRDDLHCDGCAKLSGLFQLCQFRANVKSGQGGGLPRTPNMNTIIHTYDSPEPLFVKYEDQT